MHTLWEISNLIHIVIRYKNILTDIIYARDRIDDYDWTVEVHQLAVDRQ